MFSREWVRRVLPYYIAMIGLLFVTLMVVERVVGTLTFWPALAVIIVSGLIYEAIFRRFGWSPGPPEKET